jgi:hypothetical protein
VGGVDGGPHFYDGEDFNGREVCESEVVGWRESQDVTFSCYGVGAEEEVREVCTIVSVSDFCCVEMDGRKR